MTRDIQDQAHTQTDSGEAFIIIISIPVLSADREVCGRQGTVGEQLETVDTLISINVNRRRVCRSRACYSDEQVSRLSRR